MSVSGFFHIVVNKKSFLNRPLLPAGGRILKRVPALLSALSTSECNKWKAWHSGEATRLATVYRWWIKLHSSFWTLSTQNLVFLYFNALPSSINTSSTQTICCFSHIDSLLHISLFISISHFLSAPSFCSSLPCLLRCFAPALTFFPPL